jgi:hypothetical protein
MVKGLYLAVFSDFTDKILYESFYSVLSPYTVVNIPYHIRLRPFFYFNPSTIGLIKTEDEDYDPIRRLYTTKYDVYTNTVHDHVYNVVIIVFS